MSSAYLLPGPEPGPGTGAHPVTPATRFVGIVAPHRFWKSRAELASYASDQGSENKPCGIQPQLEDPHIQMAINPGLF